MKYIYSKSPVKNKKLRTIVDGKTIDFGDTRYDHYFDKSGIWSSKNHNDAKRRKNYLTRSGGIKNKQGKLTMNDPSSPNYHSRRVLW